MDRIKQVLILILLLAHLPSSGLVEADKIEVRNESDGWMLLVNSGPLMVNGMNRDYFPVGTNRRFLRN